MLVNVALALAIIITSLWARNVFGELFFSILSPSAYARMQKSNERVFCYKTELSPPSACLFKIWHKSKILFGKWILSGLPLHVTSIEVRLRCWIFWLENTGFYLDCTPNAAYARSWASNSAAFTATCSTYVHLEDHEILRNFDCLSIYRLCIIIYESAKCVSLISPNRKHMLLYIHIDMCICWWPPIGETHL